METWPAIPPGNSIESRHRYVVFDVETTGLSSRNGDRVIEIGAVAIEDQNINFEFSSLIDVDRDISWRVQQVHGITNETLKGEPKPDEVLPGVLQIHCRKYPCGPQCGI